MARTGAGASGASWRITPTEWMTVLAVRVCLASSMAETPNTPQTVTVTGTETQGLAPRTARLPSDRVDR